MPINPLLTELEVASLLRVSARSLRALRSAGSVPHLVIGRRVRYRPEDIEGYLQAAKVDPSQEGVLRRRSNAARGQATIVPFTQLVSVRAKG